MCPWVTPDAPPGEPICIRIYCPSGVDYEASLRGAVLQLENENNWEQVGAQSAETVAEAFSISNDMTLNWGKCMPVGTVIWGAWGSIPDGFIVCDGAQYATNDYAELFNAIGYTFGGANTVFNVPDLVDKFIVGAGGGMARGDTGGEASHTLTTSEIPSHSHSIPQPITTLNDIPVGTTPVLTPGITSQQSGSTGGGEPHNNLPPYVALIPVISYR